MLTAKYESVTLNFELMRVTFKRRAKDGRIHTRHHSVTPTRMFIINRALNQCKDVRGIIELNQNNGQARVFIVVKI